MMFGCSTSTQVPEILRRNQPEFCSRSLRVQAEDTRSPFHLISDDTQVILLRHPPFTPAILRRAHLENRTVVSLSRLTAIAPNEAPPLHEKATSCNSDSATHERAQTSHRPRESLTCVSCTGIVNKRCGKIQTYLVACRIHRTGASRSTTGNLGRIWSHPPAVFPFST